MSDSPWVELKQVSFSYNDRPILQSMNISIAAGKITAVMGPSGTGKTTILRLIGGAIQPAAGEVWVEGQQINQLSSSALYEQRQRMGLLFQSAALFSNFTAFENVAFPIRAHTNLPESMIRAIVLMKLEAVGLRGAHNLYPRELSGGMARRVALARAIALDPKLIMYDEPFAGQDPISMGVLTKLIKLLNIELGMTTIIVSHDVHETLAIADYIYVVAEGRVVGEGTPEALMSSENAHVKQFLQGLPDGVVPFNYPAPDYEEDLLDD